MAWKRIIIGVDGSPESVRAAVIGSMVAQRAGAPCTLISAVPDYQKILGSYGMATQARETAEDVMARDRALLTASLKGYVPADLIDSLEIRVGRPAIVLREAAQRLDAGLIVVGGRLHRGLDRIRGLLVSHLLRTCDVPVLVVDGGSPVIQRVLAALDLSSASGPTWDAARQWTRLFSAHLRVMHVVEPMPVLPHASIQLSEEYYHADERLRETGIWAEIGDRDAEKVVRSGHAPVVIANEVAQWRADLLIVGSHGRGWTERVLIGSTTEDLVAHLPTLTLVIPTGRPAEERPLAVGRLPWEQELDATVASTHV